MAEGVVTFLPLSRFIPNVSLALSYDNGDIFLDTENETIKLERMDRIDKAKSRLNHCRHWVAGSVCCWCGQESSWRFDAPTGFSSEAQLESYHNGEHGAYTLSGIKLDDAGQPCEARSALITRLNDIAQGKPNHK